MPRPKSILGDTRIALMYPHMLASHWTIGWAINFRFFFFFFGLMLLSAVVASVFMRRVFFTYLSRETS